MGSAETVNKRIARYRKLMDLSQAELAEKIGMKASTYSQMERCGNITTQRLLDIAKALKVDANDLLNGEGYITVTQQGNNTAIFGQQPVIPWPPIDSGKIKETHKTVEEPDFVLTKHEETVIELYRYISQSDRDDIDILLNQRYQKARNKNKL